jgi:glycerol-3-phosphate dehydrogenase
LLFLDTRAALTKAPQVARELAQALGRDEAWQQAQITAFKQTATHYLVP